MDGFNWFLLAPLPEEVPSKMTSFSAKVSQKFLFAALMDDEQIMATSHTRRE